MKEIIKRKVDELGRVVIPIEMRTELDLHEKDLLDMVLENNTIIISKSEPNCIICGSKESLVVFNETYICKNCTHEVSKLDK